MSTGCPHLKVKCYQRASSSTNRTLCLCFFRAFQTAGRCETNAYCFPTPPMAGSGTWLPCGMTPHPWLRPEVTPPNLVVFAGANIKTTASQLTSVCCPMDLPPSTPPLGLSEHLAVSLWDTLSLKTRQHWDLFRFVVASVPLKEQFDILGNVAVRRWIALFLLWLLMWGEEWGDG